MFHFRTNHSQERRDGFVSFRCFLWLGGGGKRTERTGAGLGGGGMEEDFERREEDFERTKKGLRGRRNKDFEKEKKGNRESCDSIAVFS